MTKQQAAEAVKAAVVTLNNATERACELGVVVELETVRINDIGSEPQWLVSVRVMDPL